MIRMLLQQRRKKGTLPARTSTSNSAGRGWQSKRGSRGDHQLLQMPVNRAASEPSAITTPVSSFSQTLSCPGSAAATICNMQLTA